MNIDPSLKYRMCAAKGMTQAQASRDLGVSREAVRQMANRHGIEFTPDCRADETDAKLYECHGLTRKQAAKKTGLHYQTVLRRGDELGIQFAPTDRFDEMRAAAYRKYKALADEGLTTGEAARRLGVSGPNITYAAKKYGVKFVDGRTKRWAK